MPEPALTLITEAGGGVIANAMHIEEANRYLGGAYGIHGCISARRRTREAP